jgi:hypothetical protein
MAAESARIAATAATKGAVISGPLGTGALLDEDNHGRIRRVLKMRGNTIGIG